MIEKKIKSALPIYIAAGVFVLAAIILPIYKLSGILIAAGLSLIAYAVSDKMIKPRTVMVEAPATIYATGEASLDQTLAKAEADLKTLAALNGQISDPELTKNIARMEKAGKSILAEVAKNPKKAKNISKFVAYYLPTSIKILTSYVDLSKSGATGDNAQSLMAEVKANSNTIATAFEKQLDALFADKVLDVSSDITVLDGMVRGDGLTNADNISKAANAATVKSDVASQLAADLATGKSVFSAPAAADNGSLAQDLAKNPDDVKPTLTL